MLVIFPVSKQVELQQSAVQIGRSIGKLSSSASMGCARKGAIWLLNQETLQSGDKATPIGARQMRVGGERSRPIALSPTNEVLEQVQFLAQFPEAPAEGMEQGTLLQLGQLGAEFAEPGTLVEELRGFFLPFGWWRLDELLSQGKEPLRVRAIFVGQVKAIAQQHQVLQGYWLASSGEPVEPIAHRLLVLGAGIPGLLAMDERSQGLQGDMVERQLVVRVGQ